MVFAHSKLPQETKKRKRPRTVHAPRRAPANVCDTTLVQRRKKRRSVLTGKRLFGPTQYAPFYSPPSPRPPNYSGALQKPKKKYKKTSPPMRKNNKHRQKNKYKATKKNYPQKSPRIRAHKNETTTTAHTHTHPHPHTHALRNVTPLPFPLLKQKNIQRRSLFSPLYRVATPSLSPRAFPHPLPKSSLSLLDAKITPNSVARDKNQAPLMHSYTKQNGVLRRSVNLSFSTTPPTYCRPLSNAFCSGPNRLITRRLLSCDNTDLSYTPLPPPS